MGNADFKAILTEPVVEVQVGKVFLLASGGYQNSNSFTSGTCCGFEIYFPFSCSVTLTRSIAGSSRPDRPTAPGGQ